MDDVACFDTCAASTQTDQLPSEGERERGIKRARERKLELVATLSISVRSITFNSFYYYAY